jgi:hypothetical protein
VYTELADECAASSREIWRQVFTQLAAAKGDHVPEERIGRFRFVICWAEDSRRATKTAQRRFGSFDMNKKDNIDRAWDIY